jgi:putative transposase
MQAALALPVGLGLTAGTCDALGVSRASLYRGRARLARPPASSPRAKLRSPRALSVEERRHVLDRLCEPRFVDLAPAEIYATLLDEGTYQCSIRTMYRILAEHSAVRERRNQLRHPVYQKPELLAEAPNQVWSWDITKLMGPAKWSYFYLYVILDIFSRRVVGWCVADAESATLFKALFDDTLAKHAVLPGQLTLHADRGGPMKAKATALMLADLGVPSRTADRIPPTTPRSRKPTSRPSNTSRSSPSASAASRTPKPSAAASSPGITSITITPASPS